MKVKSESEVAQSCPTLGDTMDCSLPGSSVHGIFQPRVLEWGVIAFSGGNTRSVYICDYISDPLKSVSKQFYFRSREVTWVEEPGRLQSMGSRRVRHD